VNSAELTAEELASIRRPLSEASTLPLRCYTDQAYHELEIDRVLRRSWIPVGRWDQVENTGDYITTEVIGEPVLTVRGKDGVLRSFSNVCPHRRMRLAEGQGCIKRIECPYHRWVYELDGKFRGAPLMDKSFDKSRVRLTPIRTEVWNGFVFINFDHEADSLSPQLEPLDAILEPYRIGEWRIASEDDAPIRPYWNWKLTIENGSESYHHMGLHKNSLESELSPTRLTEMPEKMEGPYLQYRNHRKDGVAFSYGWDGPKLPPGNEGSRIINIFPLCNFDLEEDWMAWQKVLPGSTVDDHKLSYVYLVPPQAFDYADFKTQFEQLKRDNGEVWDEDRQGLIDWWETHKTKHFQAETVGFSPLEAGLVHFQHWLVDLISKA
jgi:phenylpropionate dioxygenase-like ring-hydroxylating dioxygenase large terminal subunit